MVALMGMVLVSLASAGLVDFLSNSVSGTIEVLGPVFYTASSNELIVNEKPSNGYWNSISDGSYVKREWVMSESEVLGGIDFYKPEIKFVVKLEIDDDFNVSRGIDLEFGYYDSSESKKAICSVQYISIIENGTIEIECPTNSYEHFIRSGDIENVERFYYAFEPLSSKEYRIKTKDSYVKIIGVVQ